MGRLRHKAAFQNSCSWVTGGAGFRSSRPHCAMLHQTLRVVTKSINCNSQCKMVGNLNSMAWVLWWTEDWAADGHHMGPVKPGFRKPVPTWASNKEPFRYQLLPMLGNHRIYLEEPGLHLLWSWLGAQSESSIIRGLNLLTFGLAAGVLDKHQSYWWVRMSAWFVAPRTDG